MAVASLTSQPQDEPCAGSSPVLPADPVETLPEMVREEEPELMVEQTSAEEDVTLPDMTNGNLAIADDEINVSSLNQEDPGWGETVDEAEQINKKTTSDITDKDKEDENVTDGETNDPDTTTRKSERLQCPPEHFL